MSTTAQPIVKEAKTSKSWNELDEVLNASPLDRTDANQSFPSDTPLSEAKPQEASNSTNPVLLVLRAMKIAKGILRKGYQETKTDNKNNEKRWEKTVEEIKKQHENTSWWQKKMSYLHIINPIIYSSGVIGGQWIDSKGFDWYYSKTQKLIPYTTEDNYSLVKYPATKLKEGIDLFKNAENKPEKVEKFVSTFKDWSSSFLSGQTETLRTDNEAKQAPLNMRSTAASSLHQNKGSDESGEKQQLTEMDRSARELMQHEAEIYRKCAERA